MWLAAASWRGGLVVVACSCPGSRQARRLDPLRWRWLRPRLHTALPATPASCFDQSCSLTPLPPGSAGVIIP